MNEDLILTKDVVDQLFHLYNLDVVSRVSVVKNMNDVLENDNTMNGERVKTDNDDCVHENIDNHVTSNITESNVSSDQCDFIDVERINPFGH